MITFPDNDARPDYMAGGQLHPFDDADYGGTGKLWTWNLGKGRWEPYLAFGSAAAADLIDDDTFATATAVNIPSALSVKTYVDDNAGGGGGGDITVQDEGTPLATAATTLNFVGAGVVASGTGATKTITIAGAGTVTSVAVSGANGIGVTGSPITASGTVALSLGEITPSSVNKVTITAPATTATLTIAEGKTLTASNSITLAGTDASTLNIGTGGTLGTGAFLAVSGTNTGDNATNSQYSGLVTNADHSGDATGSGALTLATVNANVGSFGSATSAVALTVNGKGLVTAASASTITPAIGSITGLGTGVATALAVNLGSAGALARLSDVTGTNSNTNTGDQTITLTGGVTGSGTGSFAATVVTNANLTGVVTSTGNATSIANGAITNAMLANAAVANLTNTNTGDETAARIATIVNAATEDTAPLDADLLPMTETAAAGALRRLTFANLAAYIVGVGRTLAGAWVFSSTTRPTAPNVTSVPAAMSLITLTDSRNDNKTLRNLSILGL